MDDKIDEVWMDGWVEFVDGWMSVYNKYILRIFRGYFIIVIHVTVVFIFILLRKKHR